jgi:hypothetical protein
MTRASLWHFKSMIRFVLRNGLRPPVPLPGVPAPIIDLRDVAPVPAPLAAARLELSAEAGITSA